MAIRSPRIKSVTYDTTLNLYDLTLRNRAAVCCDYRLYNLNALITYADQCQIGVAVLRRSHPSLPFDYRDRVHRVEFTPVSPNCASDTRYQTVVWQ